jgi:hypothetical protein
MSTNRPSHGRELSAEPRSVAHDSPRAVLGLRALDELFQATPGDEAAAWAKLEARRSAKRPRWPLLLAGATAVAGLIALVVARPRQADAPPGAAPSATVTASRRAPVEQRPTPAPLPVGSSVLPGGVRANLHDGGRAAWISTSRRGGRLVLERGTLQIDTDAPVDVQVAALHVDASPGRFQISSRDGGVDVAVETGEVAVWSSVRLIRRIVAGERWTSGDATESPAPELAPRPHGSSTHTRHTEPPAPAAAEPAAVPATPTPAAESRDCLRLARDGVTDVAIACFEAQTAQPGLTGEIALLELARIRRDVKGDLAGAERLLSEHARRYPRGALAAEASVMHVELLLRLGRPAQALAEADHLDGAEAIFWRAAALEKLGRRGEAAQAFDAYLQHGGVERRAEAARRRAELGP